MGRDGIRLRANARPSERELSDLCEVVGWARFGDGYAALDHYSVTTSAWADERLVAWTSVVSDNVRHAFLLDVMVHPESRCAQVDGWRYCLVEFKGDEPLVIQR
jgi:hypothetical protein